MTQDLIPVHYPMTVAEHPSEVNWEPLIDYIEFKTRAVMLLRLDSEGSLPEPVNKYMYVGNVGPVFLYKHIDTRQYINVDAQGRLYEYRDGGYWPITPA